MTTDATRTLRHDLQRPPTAATLGAPPLKPLDLDGSIPSLNAATAWLNSPPLAGADLRGSVVAVQFWTHTCINWLRTVASVRAWDGLYRPFGLVVLGVHAPEFSFEHDVAGVRREVSKRHIEYPVAIDNEFALWSGFANHYWPALFLVDGRGRIRYHHVGESDYDDAERGIRRLLRELGNKELPPELGTVTGSGIEAAADWDRLRTIETYLGYARGDRFTSAGGARPDRPYRYALPTGLRTGQWALGGDWVIGAESADSTARAARLACAFEARDVHLVMGPGALSVPFRVLIDGMPPGADHGEDVDASGLGSTSEPRLYDLVRQRGEVRQRVVEVEFLEPDVRLFSLTFG